MSINGRDAGGIPLLHKQPPTVKFDVTEGWYRTMAGQIKADIERMGGGIPMPDPGGFILIGLVLDKLNDISARLAALEMKVRPPNPQDL